MDLRLPNVGDVVTCKYFDALHPEKAWMCFDIDHERRVCEFRTYYANRMTSSRRVDFYEIDMMLTEGIMIVVYPTSVQYQIAEKT